jgi:hypothetical protein
MVKRISWRKVGAPVGVALVCAVVAAAPALADTQTKNLTIHQVGPPQSETCLEGRDGICTDLRETLTVTSNLAGKGTLQLALTRTFLDNDCFSAEETTTITFDAGTISTQTSFPAACSPPKGLLINELFDITGGTGAFTGATGGGREFTAPGGPSPLIYIGTITF